MEDLLDYVRGAMEDAAEAGALDPFDPHERREAVFWSLAIVARVDWDAYERAVEACGGDVNRLAELTLRVVTARWN